MGWRNSLPFVVGGGTTPTEDVYNALVSAVGGRATEGGGAGPEEGLEDAWRIVKSQAIAAALGADERALYNAFPFHATDFLEVWEEVLRIPRAPTDQERRIAITDALAAFVAADIPSIREALTKIDPGLDVDVEDYAQAVTTEFGKLFGPWDGSVPYGLTSTAWPNYSTSFTLKIRWTLAAGVATPDPVKLATLRRKLNDILPSWEDFVIYNGLGFYLDGGAAGTSILDFTAFDG